jgi:regulatory protein
LKGSEKTGSQCAYERALLLLARRDHGVAELKRKLVEKGFPEINSDEAIERLLQQGLLDDVRFAEKIADASVRNGRGVGPKLFSDLIRKGISPDIARHAVEEAASRTHEFEALALILSKRFAAFDPSSAAQKEKQRVFGYLQRRGFSLSSILSFFRNQERGVE